ncbi:MAG: molybdenum cofactor biosynthesis protein B [Litorimonas sp.]
MRFGIDETATFTPVTIAVVIMSDTRTFETDTSGALLESRIREAGHLFHERTIVSDDVSAIRTVLKGYIADPEVNVVITSGGTGLTGRDVTPEAIEPLFDKSIDGFSTLFHSVSLKTVGLSTMQSRAVAGLANGTLIFCLPGSNGGVRDGWDKIISPQLDSRYRPCSFIGLVTPPSKS